MDWIACDKWDDLPVGEWLVKISKDRKPYHIAVASENRNSSRVVIVGNHFHFDMGDIIAYTGFDRYEVES